MATDEHDVIEGELVTVEHNPPPLTLFGTSDPTEALARMSTIASALVDVIRDRKLIVNINGHEHLTAEAWCVLGGMTGIVPVVAWTRRLEDGTGWEARVEARTLDGRVVGAAESMCTRAERQWRTRDEFALRSMAQTRAIGRALRAPLGQVVRLAGYDPAAAEEMPQETAQEPPPSSSGGLPQAVRPTGEQGERLRDLIAQLGERDPDTDWLEKAREIAGGPWNSMTRAGADGLIRQLEQIRAEQNVAEEP